MGWGSGFGERQGGRDRGQGSEVGDPKITQISRTSKKETEVGDLRFRHTWDIIAAAENGLLPDKIMFNTHPQRWDDKPWPWVKELVFQNTKNIAKMLLNKARST